MIVTSNHMQTDLGETLISVTEWHHRSNSLPVNQAFEKFLHRETQEQHRWQETEEALESARSGRVVEGEVVHEWLDSWGDEAEKTTPKL